MILDSQRLKSIFDLLVHQDFRTDSLNLEISRLSEDHVVLAVNYGDLYYISCTINTSNEVDDEDIGHIVVPKDGLVKLNQLVNTWPKSSVKIVKTDGLISFEVVTHGQLLREKPVHVECLFQPAVNDYVVEPPTMKYNCVVNSKNLKQMLEFCSSVSDGVFIEVRDGSLAVSSTNSSLATLVELDELVRRPSKRIKLSTEANGLVIAFLSRLVSKFNLVYLLFIEHETAFSIRIEFDELTTIQIYAIHD